VHHNSGIANQAFYLTAEGGVNRTSGRRAVGLGPGGREKAERIFYRGFTAYLTPSASFRDARAATVRAARELYGESEGLQSTAWSAVGVE
jgi:Zn-dependent metalloprotease